eukprot:TRINITY_DN9322_c0_g1_i2.p1 TRINITY_DN9322_c0_g1~~TRINITY_DN9322_c0_g1_i2.p1  ORF type:complete len:1659 (+),score=336.30 TRINITY_DN9322_c0_g1_i2:46-5022(+)
MSKAKAASKSILRKGSFAASVASGSKDRKKVAAAKHDGIHAKDPGLGLVRGRLVKQAANKPGTASTTTAKKGGDVNVASKAGACVESPVQASRKGRPRCSSPVAPMAVAHNDDQVSGDAKAGSLEAEKRLRESLARIAALEKALAKSQSVVPELLPPNGPVVAPVTRKRAKPGKDANATSGIDSTDSPVMAAAPPSKRLKDASGSPVAVAEDVTVPTSNKSSKVRMTSVGAHVAKSSSVNSESSVKSAARTNASSSVQTEVSKSWALWDDDYDGSGRPRYKDTATGKYWLQVGDGTFKIQEESAVPKPIASSGVSRQAAKSVKELLKHDGGPAATPSLDVKSAQATRDAGRGPKRDGLQGVGRGGRGIQSGKTDELKEAVARTAVVQGVSESQTAKVDPQDAVQSSVEGNTRAGKTQVPKSRTGKARKAEPVDSQPSLSELKDAVARTGVVQGVTESQTAKVDPQDAVQSSVEGNTRAGKTQVPKSRTEKARKAEPVDSPPSLSKSLETKASEVKLIADAAKKAAKEAAEAALKASKLAEEAAKAEASLRKESERAVLAKANTCSSTSASAESKKNATANIRGKIAANRKDATNGNPAKSCDSKASLNGAADEHPNSDGNAVSRKVGRPRKVDTTGAPTVDATLGAATVSTKRARAAAQTIAVATTSTESVPVAAEEAATGTTGVPSAEASCTAEPFRRRQRKKGIQVTTGPTVAQLLRKLCSEEDNQEDAAMVGVADSAEIDALVNQRDPVGDEELQGEGDRAKGRPKTKKVAQQEDGEDDDRLFDEDDDLEGEEAVSDNSDVEDDGESEEVDDDEEWVPVNALEYPRVWRPDGVSSSTMPRPGEASFNAYAAECLKKAELGSELSPFAKLNMRLHQESCAFLLHPESPVQRLLVDHATGTGKTLIMLRVLENFFDDPRPKVAIFPKERVCDNFYLELLKWPTRWRDFVAASCPVEASLASGAANWKRLRSEMWDLNNERLRAEAKKRGVRQEKILREIIDATRAACAMKNSIRKGKILTTRFANKFKKEHKGMPVPRAPLRAFRYTTAGGSACELGQDGWPRSPVLKAGFDKIELNPYSQKVIIMDEAHNLVRPSTQFEEQLGRLRLHLYGARGSVLAGFTGTPVGNDAEEGRQLLDVIKGQAAQLCCDEGFVSSFHARANADFPREIPVKGIPDGVVHEGMFDDLVKRTSLHGEALKRYLLKEVEFQIVPRLLRLPEEKRMARLANYCNIHVHYGHFYGAHKEALLKDMKNHAPKFFAVVRSVQKNPEKAVVMLSREMGYKVMVDILRKTGRKHGFRVATLDELGDFNDARKNLRGERFRVLVAETNQAGEGIQFKQVRRLYLVDVPLRHSDIVQRCSRCVRLGGHAALPEAERSLAIELHVAQIPKFLRSGPGALIYREIINAKDVMAIPGTAIENATLACMEELKTRNVKSLKDLQTLLQADEGPQLIDLMTETVLEHFCATSSHGARPLGVALWRMRRGGDDLDLLDSALRSQVRTADEQILEWLVDKSSELLPPLEDMRMNAVDRCILAKLGDPPRAPPARSEIVKKKTDKAKKKLKADVQESAPREDPPPPAADSSEVVTNPQDVEMCELPEVGDADDDALEEEDEEEDEVADLDEDDFEIEFDAENGGVEDDMDVDAEGGQVEDGGDLS